MPIEGPKLPRLSTKEFRELDYSVMGLAFETHRQLGRFCDEGIYQNDLANNLVSAESPPILKQLFASHTENSKSVIALT